MKLLKYQMEWIYSAGMTGSVQCSDKLYEFAKQAQKKPLEKNYNYSKESCSLN